MNTIARTLASLDPEAGASTEITSHDEELLRTIMATPIAEPMRKKRTHVRRTIIIGGLVAATVALGLMKIDIGGHDVGASPAAAKVLERAAEVTLKQSDPVVGPGQYLRKTLVQQTWDEGVGSDGKPFAVQTRWTMQIWIPYDRDQNWIRRERTTLVSTTSQEAAERVRLEAKQSDGTWTLPSWSDKAGKSYIKTYDPAWYATLPRDPQKLLAKLKGEDQGDGSSTDYYFNEVFSEVLRSGVAPADLRAALFKGLAETPGMKVDDDVATLDGRRGVAIGYGKGKQMVFDRKSGAYIGERATDPDFPNVPGLDAHEPTFLTSNRTDVVDSAPEPD
jgi:hypothetical protein